MGFCYLPPHPTLENCTAFNWVNCFLWHLNPARVSRSFQRPPWVIHYHPHPTPPTPRPTHLPHPPSYPQHPLILLTPPHVATDSQQLKFWNRNMGEIPPQHRRRIKTEEKAKVVAADCLKEFIQFLAALEILHQDDLKKRMNSSNSLNHPGAFHPSLQIVLEQNS